MTPTQTVIKPAPAIVVEFIDRNHPPYVNRRDIADIATGLILALGHCPESEGVVMLARALGCTVRGVRQ